MNGWMDESMNNQSSVDDVVVNLRETAEKQGNRETEKQRNRETEKQRNRETGKQKNSREPAEKANRARACGVGLNLFVSIYFNQWSSANLHSHLTT